MALCPAPSRPRLHVLDERRVGSWIDGDGLLHQPIKQLKIGSAERVSADALQAWIADQLQKESS
jgi:hypothetical protein